MNIQNLRPIKLGQLTTSFSETINIINLEHLVNLIHINLSRNKISTLYHTTFNKMPNLEYINIRHNYLSIIDHIMFDGLIRLKEIDLRNNRLYDTELILPNVTVLV